MAAISFKSVGRTQSELATIAANRSIDPRPIGIKTPLSLGGTGSSLFVMTTSLADSIKDNLRNLLLTNHGERVALHDFGANLQPLSTELTATEDFESQAMSRIKTAVAKFMPFIQLQTFEIKNINDMNEHTGKVQIRITYSVPTLGLQGKVIEVTLFVI